ncbi:Ubiquinone/menaquinone biosynthesis C-methyltransferase UbiE [Aliiroseovarius sp. xm-m-379]|uniref:ubiquinone/menaquinone biosynthesis methyltransferase n=1 Tax=unclassified Aliiroseovarius TaxID=2623558 RepID=UPI001569E599|nr:MULTISPECIES: ubiquinone/menaquinone biosynthesis methyltransferase [unclassified Aliiroseovarius]NRP13291.1 Ubiquinone/menaquinone biosynthesis C-methyltransferase UbiE [Aliiroseovarius sp. xm-d-517]NRP25946.1 Ubiquinone/menaquinone biosynthesis C-methyltransferase UbiE [Aliiroseovarius sp. xm-m-379]NRP30313.1 Ubiquinone/menaquinone biosynthesis C-methyltransferase UbiE [Aliiroseovarius sp. xm-m-314]NRP34745.1 Ubiquinone/menaquinone biosynthesis C-methyltransferase UbiE [Aliiroseovarius sp.
MSIAKKARAQSLDELRKTFGDQEVAEEGRRDAVTSLFDRIAPRYDLMNDLMSFGTHRMWKAVMVRVALRKLAGINGPLVDLAGGTGDIAIAVKNASPDRDVIVADASSGMLEQARARAGDRLGYLHAPAENLPFEDHSIAGITLAFGLRNMTHPRQALEECARVLQPGGSLVLLEFSKPAGWFAPLYGIHSRYVIPALGSLVARDKGAYSYLVESIRRFPEGGAITRELQAAGFAVTELRSFMFGVARMHVAEVR